MESHQACSSAFVCPGPSLHSSRHICHATTTTHHEPKCLSFVKLSIALSTTMYPLRFLPTSLLVAAPPKVPVPAQHELITGKLPNLTMASACMHLLPTRDCCFTLHLPTFLPPPNCLHTIPDLLHAASCACDNTRRSTKVSSLSIPFCAHMTQHSCNQHLPKGPYIPHSPTIHLPIPPTRPPDSTSLVGFVYLYHMLGHAADLVCWSTL